MLRKYKSKTWKCSGTLFKDCKYAFYLEIGGSTSNKCAKATKYILDAYSKRYLFSKFS